MLRQPAGAIYRVVFKLTFVFVDAFTILLGCSFSSNSIDSTTTSMEARLWRSWCGAGDDEDHAGAFVMEIKKHKIMDISCH